MSASLPDNISLHGLIAIVTGGSRGIGKEISLELARRGASISIVFANPAKTNIANDTVNEINALGGGVKAIAILADLKDASSYEKIVQKTLTGLDTKIINILVHNAAQASASSIPDMTPSHFNDIMDTNLRAPVFLTQAALPYIPRGGRIILMSSISARTPNPAVTVSIYAATKAATESLARDWAFEFGHSRGITVNAVSPGLVDTDILSIMPKQDKDQLLLSTNPLTAAAPRIGNVDDIAPVVSFLASDGARWVTGTTINVNGGRTFF